MKIVKDLGMEPLRLTIPAHKPARSAVVPIAGSCPGLWPATKCTGPWLFPIRIGEMVKPAICWLCEELVAAEIDQIILVVNEATQAQMEHLFQRREDVAVLDGVPSRASAYDEELLAIGKRLVFVRQEKPTGIRDALLLCERFLEGEPFILAWGDHLCSSTAADGRGCLAQLLSGFDGGCSVAAMHCIAQELIHTAGVFACREPPSPSPLLLDKQGAQADGAKTACWPLSNVVEKPTMVYAQEHLKTPGLDDGKFLASFGQYVLTPAIFSILREKVKCHFTEALDAMRQQEGLNGVLIEGCRWDLGNIRTYTQALQAQASGSTSPAPAADGQPAAKKSRRAGAA